MRRRELGCAVHQLYRLRDRMSNTYPEEEEDAAGQGRRWRQVGCDLFPDTNF